MRVQPKPKKTLLLAVATLIAVTFIVPMVYANGLHLVAEAYTRNIFGWKTTWVKTIVHADLNGCNGKFNTYTSYTRHEAGAAWWCLTCYSRVTNTQRIETQKKIGEVTKWVQGSWNVEFRGDNRVFAYAIGGCRIEYKALIDKDATIVKAVHSIADAIEWIVKIVSQALNGGR